jgi:hypothetical protein
MRPILPENGKSAPTVQLRRDPADDLAAPPWTDDEAAGNDPSPSRIARAILQQPARPRVSGTPWNLIAVVLGTLAIILLVWALADRISLS